MATQARKCVLRPHIHVPCHRVAGQRRSITIRQLDGTKDDRERVVILGSGWAGYNLARSLDHSKFQTVVVSPRSHFVFTPLLASTSVGTLEFRTALEPVRSRHSKYEYIQGRADGIDPSAKQIIVRETVRCPNQGLLSTRAGEVKDERPIQMQLEASRGELFSMAYDKLVIGVGSYSQTFGIPGVKDNAFFLKDVNDARKIRDKLLSCFETAALPTTPVALKKQLLNFAIVGGGPTGIEFSGELSDIVRDDLSRLYPHLMEHVKVTVYDVADKILPMFDDKLSKYAQDRAVRQGTSIKTGHSIRELKRGFPKVAGAGGVDYHDDVKASGFTLGLKNGADSEVGCGLVVWSTGLMANPFLEKSFSTPFTMPSSGVETLSDAKADSMPTDATMWMVHRHSRSGSIMTDDFLRVQLLAACSEPRAPTSILRDVYALGDCAMVDGAAHPATAQVASQKAKWLARKLNHGDAGDCGFSFESQGIMAYIGAARAVVQLNKPQGNISGRAAWVIWRAAYLTRSMSWRNMVLIPMYWTLNWAFGRDISRF
ncbi:Putative FAD/NAD(P)-binding domain, FAD/NAD(P)-binding domain superfamily [Septoria linicola]|uniref:FAD/NAD(P)-binding domain, FAD/NAD(P)-binding domain superfamily n=1 Tax=Septoria linicola TaxID=215465 RepID=A0A9Q9AZL9_9PEZI|nr:Putative FAD/NAD(P)-binding domain, FAD/NAD(P)-binding domain superfamily [Septoria linicola]